MTCTVHRCLSFLLQILQVLCVLHSKGSESFESPQLCSQRHQTWQHHEVWDSRWQVSYCHQLYNTTSNSFTHHIYIICTVYVWQFVIGGQINDLFVVYTSVFSLETEKGGEGEREAI